MTSPVSLRSSNSQDPQQWASTHQGYWDGLAHQYDNLYTSYWSQRENRLVTERLTQAALPERPLVLDLGCGTGLGASLIRRIRPNASYTGVDLSPAMLAIAQSRHPEDIFVSGSFDDGMGFIDSGSVDCVMALFSTLSFSVDAAQLLTSIRRVLKPGAWAYVSALGNASMSARGRTVSPYYRTRGDNDAEGVPAYRFCASELRSRALEAGFDDVHVYGINAFSGVAEAAPLWWPGRILAQAKPDFSHLLELTFRKPTRGNQP